MSTKQESRGRYLAKNTAIFALGNIATKLITFFLVPLYTNVLSTGEYGVVDLINTICTVLAPIIIFNIGESVMRFSLDKEANYGKIMSVGLISFGCSIVLGLVAFPVAGFFPAVADYSLSIYFFLITTAASQLFLCYLRGREKLILYSFGNIIHTIAIAIFNIYFLVFKEMGVTGYFLAFTVANLVTIVYAIFAGNVKDILSCFSFDKALAKEMLKYSIVLIPNAFMWWIVNSSDRIMVTSMINIEANGIYAISYKIPTLITTITGIFNQAWSYSAIREDGSPDEIDYNNRVLKGLISIVMLLSIVMVTFIKPFLSIYVADEYYKAWKYTPFLIIGFAFLTLATFMSTSYTVHKDSFGFVFSASFGAITNIILNFALIPFIGVYGAATATCLSYVSIFVFRLIHTRKYMKYSVVNIEFISGLLMLLLSSILLFIDNEFSIIMQLLILFFSFCIYKTTWSPVLHKLLISIKKR